MSGHSKWATTKRAKAVTDAKRAGVFTKIAHLISIAARDGGGDPKANFILRMAIEKGKEVSMPKDNIERAIKRGTGELAGETLEEIIYEGYGPGGVAILIDSLTDNRNRSVSEIKHILTKHGGSFGAAGSVAWMFEKKGVIGISPEHVSDDLELDLIEAGAEDVIRTDEGVTIITTPNEIEAVKAILDSKKISTAFAEVEYRAKTMTTVSDDATKQKLEKILDDLEEHADVRGYYTNLA